MGNYLKCCVVVFGLGEMENVCLDVINRRKSYSFCFKIFWKIWHSLLEDDNSIAGSWVLVQIK